MHLALVVVFGFSVALVFEWASLMLCSKALQLAFASFYDEKFKYINRLSRRAQPSQSGFGEIREA